MSMTTLPNLSDIGYLIEGVVEQDPLSDRYLIKVEGPNGTCSQFDVQTTLAKYVGKTHIGLYAQLRKSAQGNAVR